MKKKKKTFLEISHEEISGAKFSTLTVTRLGQKTDGRQVPRRCSTKTHCSGNNFIRGTKTGNLLEKKISFSDGQCTDKYIQFDLLKPCKWVCYFWLFVSEEVDKNPNPNPSRNRPIYLQNNFNNFPKCIIICQIFEHIWMNSIWEVTKTVGNYIKYNYCWKRYFVLIS